MDKKEIGSLLKTKREALGLTPADMGRKIRCDRTTVERWERGITAIPSTKMSTIARAYEIDVQELAELCGFSADEFPHVGSDDSDVCATVEDLEFLITVARGLQKPMSIRVIRELLKCRKQK